MGFFNFVENFFLISLGITFVLILLLVYHFKQRVSSMERKGDTMFELMRNMVNEINILKRVHTYFGSPMGDTNDIPVQNITVVNPPAFHNVAETSNVDNYDSEEECSDVDDEEDDEEPQNNELSDGESAGNDDDNDTVDTHDSTDIDSVNDVDEIAVHHLVIEEIMPESKEFNIDDSDLAELEVDDFEPAESKEDSSQLVSDSMPEEITIHLPKEPVLEIDVPENKDSDIIETLEAISEPSKEESKDLGDSKESTLVEEDSSKKDSYRKMNLHQLKAVVQTLGIQTDVSKMKKNEILKLLNVN